MSDEYEFMMASMDGLSSDNKFGVEIKRANKIDHEMCMDGVVPEKYYPQIQKQALVCKLPMIFYFSFNGKSGKILEVKRDDDYINKIIQEEIKFFDLITNLESPSLSDRDYEERDDYEWNWCASQWIQVERKIKELEQEKEVIRKQLIHCAGDKNVKGYGVTLSKHLRRGTVDYKMIPEIQNVNLDKYRKEPIEYFKISVS
jgi:predicted phage-related endonuclease